MVLPVACSILSPCRSLLGSCIALLALSWWTSNSGGCDALRISDATQLSSHQRGISATSNATQSSAGRRIKVNVEIPNSPDGHLVQNPLPLTKDGEALPIQHWAGHLPASGDGEKYFFYWLFEPERVDENTPLLIWLNGGPACSSMDGLFLENGPIQWTVVDGKYQLQQNQHSWHKAPAYTLYIDQPVGTGLSFTTNGKYPTNDKEVNVDFYYFMNSFFNFHADKFVTGMTVNRPLYFSGESHAGHYIPSMMNYILSQNNKGATLTIPLAGAAIGNGWMDPKLQYAAAEAAYGHGLLGLAQVNAFDEQEQECQKALEKGNYRSNVCFGLLDSITANAYGSKSQYRISQYDVRIAEKKGAPRTFPKGHKVVECYLGGHALPSWETGTCDPRIKSTVLDAIHASAATTAGQTFYECTDPPYNALAHQDGLGVVGDIVQVLQDSSKPRLLFFNGVEDLVCNHVGNEKVLENLPWQGKTKWTTARRYAWLPNHDSPKAAGFMKEYDNLLYLKLLDAGHMCPMDLPDTSLQMMSLFMSGGSFSDSVQNIPASADSPPASCPICSTCPKQEACPACDGEPNTKPEINCSKEIETAKKEFMAAHPGSSTEGEDGQFSLMWAVPIVGLLAVVVGVMAFRKKRERREVHEMEHVELAESQYQDEPEQDDEEESRKNGEVI